MDPLIFDVEKFAVHDGPGIRTVVFLKGCPLRCLWCHNPESQSGKPELFFSPEKCTGCGRCVSACPVHCHRLENGKHLFDRTNCTGCGTCAESCFSGALEQSGKPMTVNEVMKAVLSDKVFYDNSGGGMTLSGGEPLMHFEFSRELLRAAGKAGIHTALETCGYADEAKIRELLPLVDLWLWDVKAPPERHRELTGVESTSILRNLRLIDGAGGKMHLRCPLIPGLNDSEADLIAIAELANSLRGCLRIDLEPYHPLGEAKALRLGRETYFHGAFTGKEKVDFYESVLKAHTKVSVCRP